MCDTIVELVFFYIFGFWDEIMFYSTFGEMFECVALRL